MTPVDMSGRCRRVRGSIRTCGSPRSGRRGVRSCGHAFLPMRASRPERARKTSAAARPVTTYSGSAGPESRATAVARRRGVGPGMTPRARRRRRRSPPGCGLVQVDPASVRATAADAGSSQVAADHADPGSSRRADGGQRHRGQQDGDGAQHQQPGRRVGRGQGRLVGLVDVRAVRDGHARDRDERGDDRNSTVPRVPPERATRRTRAPAPCRAPSRCAERARPTAAARRGRRLRAGAPAGAGCVAGPGPTPRAGPRRRAAERGRRAADPAAAVSQRSRCASTELPRAAPASPRT